MKVRKGYYFILSYLDNILLGNVGVCDMYSALCPNDVLFVTPAPGGAPLKVNLNTECAGLLRLVR